MTDDPVSRNDWQALAWASEAPDARPTPVGLLEARQDIPTVEAQRPESPAPDLQTELHLRSGRAAIAYRQWLKNIGLRYGTA
jgi:hypothetical protein